MNTVLRGLRAMGASVALAVGLSGVGLIVGPAAVANTVMTATTTVNVRAGASTSSAVVGVLHSGNSVSATGAATNGWTTVSYNGRTAYVYSTYLKAAGSTASPAPAATSTSLTATTLEAVNARTGPGLTYSVWTVLPKSRAITVTGVTQNGYAQLTDGHWVSTSWISVAAASTTPAASTAQALTSKASSPSLPAITGQVRATAAGPSSSAAAVALSFALAQVGKAYAWGGNGPNAYDCSGLTTAAYKQAGITLPRTSSAQFGVGTAVTLAQLQPGDLVFYYSGISHVGIYIGNGRIVHASNPTRGVVTDSVTSMPFMGGRRIG